MTERSSLTCQKCKYFRPIQGRSSLGYCLCQNHVGSFTFKAEPVCNFYGSKYKTYGEIFKEVKEKYSFDEIDDYRPFDSEFIKDKSGIICWLKNGDMVAYFPNSNIIEE